MNITQLFEQINSIKESYYQSQLLVEAQKERHRNLKVLIQGTYTYIDFSFKEKIKDIANSAEMVKQLSIDKEEMTLKSMHAQAFLAERKRVQEEATQRLNLVCSEVAQMKDKKRDER